MNARLAIRMFGKVRNILNRAIIPRTSTFPATAKTASNGRSTSTDIVVEEYSCIFRIFVARPAPNPLSNIMTVSKQHRSLYFDIFQMRFHV